MSLNTTTLFTRLGHLLGALGEANLYRGTTAVARAATLQADYASADQNIVDGIDARLASLQSANGAWPSYLRGVARALVIQQVNEAASLPDRSLATAINYLVSYMVANSVTVKASVVGSTVTPGGSNIGNAVCLCSTKLASGKSAENLYAETVTGTVTVDSQSGGATAGNETVNFRGLYAVTDPLSWLYPAGSGANVSPRAISPTPYQTASANWLTGSDFETFTVANIPDGFHVGVGAAGTQVLKSTAQHYAGISSLQFVGDSSTLTSVYQGFSSASVAGDSSVVMTPSTQFAVNLWAKVDVAPAAGVLQVSLTDGSGTVINDGQGNANSFTANLVTLGSSFVPVNGFFRTPAVLPSAVRLQLKLTTALSTGSNLFMDRLAMAKPASLYTQSPGIAVFSGSANLIAGDTYGIALTNTVGGLQAGCDKLFGMKSLGYLLPSSGSPSLSDGLIV